MNTQYVTEIGCIVRVDLDPTARRTHSAYLADFLDGRLGVVEDYNERHSEGPRCLVRFKGTAHYSGNSEDGECSWWVEPINLTRAAHDAVIPTPVYDMAQGIIAEHIATLHDRGG